MLAAVEARDDREAAIAGLMLAPVAHG